ncbi:MAG: TAXI family TRAP transporter solute-binding subunit [Candidatus Methylomirabilales bacterium]
MISTLCVAIIALWAFGCAAKTPKAALPGGKTVKHRFLIVGEQDNSDITGSIKPIVHRPIIFTRVSSPVDAFSKLLKGHADFIMFSGQRRLRTAATYPFLSWTIPVPLGKSIRLAGLFQRYLHLVTTNQSGLQVLEHMKGRTISVGPKRSDTETAMIHLLKALGLSCERKTVFCENTPFGKEKDKLIAQRIHMFGLLAPVPAQNVSLVGSDLRIIAIPKDVIERMNKVSLNVYYPGRIEMKHYVPGSHKSIETVAVVDYVTTAAKADRRRVLRLAEDLASKKVVYGADFEALNVRAVKKLLGGFTWFPGTAKLFIGKPGKESY